MHFTANAIVDMIAPASKAGATAAVASSSAPNFARLLRGALSEDGAPPLNVLIANLPPPAQAGLAAIIPLQESNSAATVASNIVGASMQMSAADATPAAAPPSPQRAEAQPPSFSLPQQAAAPAHAPAWTPPGSLSNGEQTVETLAGSQPQANAAPPAVSQTQSPAALTQAANPDLSLLGRPAASSSPQIVPPAAAAPLPAAVAPPDAATASVLAPMDPRAVGERAAAAAPSGPGATVARAAQRGAESPSQESRAKLALLGAKTGGAASAMILAPQNTNAAKEPGQSAAVDPSAHFQLSAHAATGSYGAQGAGIHDHAVRAAPAAVQIAREIVRRFDGESTRFEVRLDPPELGRVEVRLEVTRDHRVTAVVSADTQQALTELTRHARELEQTLQSAGLQLNENGLSFDLRQSRGEAAENDAEGAASGASDTGDTADAAPLTARPVGLERWRGVRLDMTV